MEIWKDIKNYEGLYQVSNEGRVRSLDHITLQKNFKGRMVQTKYKGRILTHGKGLKNYWRMTLSKNNVLKRFFLHQLVADAFIPNPDNKPYVDHIDGNPENNKVENLRWATTLENNRNPITLERLRESKKGYTNNEVKKVARCNDNWDVLEIYDSLKDARRKGYCNVRYAIYKAQSHMHNGFKWKFIN